MVSDYSDVKAAVSLWDVLTIMSFTTPVIVGLVEGLQAGLFGGLAGLAIGVLVGMIGLIGARVLNLYLLRVLNQEGRSAQMVERMLGFLYLGLGAWIIASAFIVFRIMEPLKVS